MARKLQIREWSTPKSDLVRLDGIARLVSRGATRSDEIILVHSVAAQPDAAHQNSVLVKRCAAGEQSNPVPVWFARCGQMHGVERILDVDQGPGAGAVNSRRVEGLREKSQGPRRKCDL